MKEVGARVSLRILTAIFLISNLLSLQSTSADITFTAPSTDNSALPQFTSSTTTGGDSCAIHDTDRKPYAASFTKCCPGWHQEGGNCVTSPYAIPGHSDSSGTASKAIDQSDLLKAHYETCSQETEAAASTCDPKQNQMMNGVMGFATSTMEQMASDALNKAAQVDPAAPQAMKADFQSTCMKMGNLSQTANIATGSYKAYCAAAFVQCQSACDTDISNITAALGTNPELKIALEDAKKVQRQCASLSKNIAGALADMTKFAATSKNMTDCLVKTNPALSQITDKCANNIFDPSCASQLNSSDCLNPANAASPACVCSNPQSANNAMCGSLKTNNFPGMGASNPSSGSPAALSNFGGPGGGLGDGLNFPDGSGKSPDGANPSGGPGGGGGGSKGGMISSGGTGGKPAGAGGPAASRFNSSIIGGYGYSGGSAGGGSRPLGALGDPRGNNPGRAAAAGGIPKVDLSQFLPGGKFDPARALAGISGPDGITGPNSNIWEKVRIRYFSVKPSLLP